MGNILGFLLGNWRIISIVFGIFIGSTFLWNGVQYIRTSAQNEVLIEVSKKNEEVLMKVIEEQRRTLELQTRANDILDEVTIERDKEVNSLNSKYSTIVSDDLGVDLKDAAPESIKELIRRMSEK